MCQGVAWVNINEVGGGAASVCVAMRRPAGSWWVKVLKLVSMRNETKNQQFLFWLYSYHCARVVSGSLSAGR